MLFQIEQQTPPGRNVFDRSDYKEYMTLFERLLKDYIEEQDKKYDEEKAAREMFERWKASKQE